MSNPERRNVRELGMGGTPKAWRKLDYEVRRTLCLDEKPNVEN